MKSNNPDKTLLPVKPMISFNRVIGGFKKLEKVFNNFAGGSP